jgi:hypothetical protein
MNASKRLALGLLIAAILLFVGLLFWPFLVRNIIQPLALVAWLLLRILVLSLHQKYFWYAAIAVALLVLFRLLPRMQPDAPSDAYLGKNSTIINIEYWRSLFIYNGQTVQEEKTLKRELTHLLASLYASKQSTADDFRIHEALKQGRLPLPENLHTLLFTQEPPAAGGTLQKLSRSIRKTAREWIRQWTGQEKAEHYQMIEQALTFMETSLEIKNDDGNPTQTRH